MRLLYLVLATIFGVLSVISIFTIIFHFGKTTLIFAAIYITPFLLSFRQYRRIVRKDENAIIDKKAAYDLEFQNYQEAHSAALQQYTNDVNHILITRYHFKEDYRPEFIVHPDYKNDYKFIKEGLRADQAAKIIFDEVVREGNEFSPQIMQEQYLKGKLSKFSGFYKAIFGSYAPSRKRVFGFSIFFLGLYLAGYGCPQIFSPNKNVYVPSQMWTDIAIPLTYIFSALTLVWFLRNKPYNARLKKQQKNGRWIVYILMPFFIWAFFYLSITLGFGKMLNQIVGTEQTADIFVTKDLNTQKGGPRHRVTAYCVKLAMPNIQPIQNEYCLQKEHYDKVPNDGPVLMHFHGVKSEFGYRIDGYYENIETLHDVYKNIMRGVINTEQNDVILRP